MVTTNSLTPNLHFLVSELLESEISEDKEVAELAIQQLNAAIEEIKPVLAYITRELSCNVRGIIVCDYGRILVMDAKAQWHIVNNRGATLVENGWYEFPFALVTEGLQRAFAEASEKRKKHLTSIDKRKEMLNQIGAIVRGEQSATP